MGNLPNPKRSSIGCFAFVIAVSAAVGLSGFFVFTSAQAPEQSSIKLDDKINPNIASIASLSRLPSIGVTRAAAIVTYREEFVKLNPTEPAFKEYNDLQKVKGIGPKITKEISGYLKFD